jgi:hypothetical protein
MGGRQMTTANDILTKGMQCLVRELGEVGAEQFISIVNREKMDYTKWREKLFDDMTVDEFAQMAVEYSKEHPFKGKKAVVL